MVGYPFLGPFGLFKMEHVCYKGKSLNNYHRFWGVEWVVMQIYGNFRNWCGLLGSGLVLYNDPWDEQQYTRREVSAKRHALNVAQSSSRELWIVDAGDVTAKISGLCHVVPLIYRYCLVYGNMLFQAFQVFISTYNYTDISNRVYDSLCIIYMWHVYSMQQVNCKDLWSTSVQICIFHDQVFAVKWLVGLATQLMRSEVGCVCWCQQCLMYRYLPFNRKLIRNGRIWCHMM